MMLCETAGAKDALQAAVCWMFSGASTTQLEVWWKMTQFTLAVGTGGWKTAPTARPTGPCSGNLQRVLVAHNWASASAADRKKAAHEGVIDKDEVVSH